VSERNESDARSQGPGLVAPPVFLAEHMGFGYSSELPALVDVSFEVRPGEALSLIGSNGCGKSTLLRLLDGLLLPTSGRIAAFGETLTAAVLADDAWNAEFRRRVALLFQDADVQLFSATVLDDVAFGPLQLGLSQKEARGRAEEMLAFFDIARLAGRSPSTLSGGEKRRVALAACLATDPQVLLLDEPFSGLDPRNQVMLAETIQELRDRGKTLVVATHDLAIASEITDRVILLSEDHRVLADAPVASVLTQTALLLQANVIHEHRHRHGSVSHSHPHAHGHLHEGGRGDEQDHSHLT
jgi:cobalt/nickel transport system ATP-binding protein